jgi:hypothetical protein
MNYPTIEKEALAVVEAIKYFKYYLLDRHFTVLSDHAPLQWLKTFKDTNSRLGRWEVELGSLNYTIQYKPGRIHQNADCLSRLKIANVHARDELKEICAQKAQDPLCIHIRNFFDKGSLTEKHTNEYPIWAKEIELYEVIERVLYRKEIPTRKRKQNRILTQVVVPLTLRSVVLKHLHDDPMSGHLAYYRTYMRVRNIYYWPTMREDIKEYCRVCQRCLENTKATFRTFVTAPVVS